MNRNIKKRILTLTLVTYIFSAVVVYAETADSLQNEIDKNQGTLDALEEEKETINEEILNQESELNSLAGEIDTQSAALYAAQEKVMEYQNEIDGLQGEINLIENEIIASENEVKTSEIKIEAIEEELIQTQKVLDGRLRSFYKIDMAQQYIYMIIKSANISELLSNIFNVGKIMSLDRELMKTLDESEKEINKQIEKINENIAIQKENQKVVLEKQDELLLAQEEFIILKEEEERQMNALIALQTEKQGVVDELASNRDDLAEEILELTSFNEQLQQQLDDIFADINNGNNNAGDSNNDGNGDVAPEIPDEGGYLRPVTGVITCHFGPRINPVTGQPGFHNGIDYGNDFGHPIKATKSGVVEYAGWLGDYGNVIIVDHGGGVQSLYAHAQDMYATYGQTVSRGETIATVGSTGMSTGPHLHFEIRINGQPQDPYSIIPY